MNVGEGERQLIAILMTQCEAVLDRTKLMMATVTTWLR